MNLYNSLSRKKEFFTTLYPNEVLMYSCGPTVYQRAHIGNFRTYTMVDLLHRVLLSKKYRVRYVTNITDVGHLTGDNLGDASNGQDRMEIAAKGSTLSIWDIANKFTEIFLADYRDMNLLPPYKFTKATDNIKEQIELIEVLERKGFTYATTDGIYFDTSKCVDYGKLSSIDYLNVVPRITENPEKKHQTDFALWKFSSPKEKRQMEWSSPWGVGFPGWHIECSAMCMKYLGNSIDIHCGGEDLKSTHHPNEIAQSESATGQIFSRFWFHSSFLLIDGKKMSKSLGNAYNIDDIKQKGFDTMDLKYFYYTGHYRKQINLTNEALQFARNSLAGLRKIVEQGIDEKNVGSVNELKYQEFMDALSDDLNTSKALAVLWGIAKDTVLSNYEKSATLLACSEVLGLALGGDIDVEEVTDEIHELLAQRELAKRAKQWDRADMIRNEIRALGFEIIDGANGQILKKKI